MTNKKIENIETVDIIKLEGLEIPFIANGGANSDINIEDSLAPCTKTFIKNIYAAYENSIEVIFLLTS